MREAAGLTQAQVSKRSGLAQPEISKLEAAVSVDDRQVSTLRRYLAALGDDLDLVAVSKHGHRIGLVRGIDAQVVSSVLPDGARILRAMSTPLKLDAHQKRCIAVKAHRDPRSVDAVLEGRARPTVEHSIREAAAELGIELPATQKERAR